MERAIVHVDMNSCYAAFALAYLSDIRCFPNYRLGADEITRSIYLSTKEAARSYGIPLLTKWLLKMQPHFFAELRNFAYPV